MKSSNDKIQTYNINYCQISLILILILIIFQKVIKDQLLPTVLMGLLYGTIPNVYWKIPRPWKTGREKPHKFINFCCIHLTQEPSGFGACAKISFSPNENIGTSDALEKSTKCKTSWLLVDRGLQLLLLILFTAYTVVHF